MFGFNAEILDKSIMSFLFCLTPVNKTVSSALPLGRLRLNKAPDSGNHFNLILCPIFIHK